MQANTSTTVLSETAKMQLMDKIDKNAKEVIAKVSLVRLDCSFDTVSRGEKLMLKDIVGQNYGMHRADVTLVYAIRQPSCPSCREHGVDVSEFASKDPKLALMGVVKSTGKNDIELLRFYQDYFRGNAIFLDEKWGLYKALGSRMISKLNIYLGYFGSLMRYSRRGIKTGDHATDNFLRGGYLLFDRDGELSFAFEVRDFEQVNIEVLAAAVAETRSKYKHKKNIHRETDMTKSESSTDSFSN